MKKTQILLLILVLGSMAGCAKLTAKRQVFVNPAGDVPQAWIDAPLDGMILPLTAYEFVSHGSSEAKIQKVEWILNDDSLGMQNAEAQNKLTTFRYTWVPVKGGEYTLKVRTQDGNGVWSGYDEVHFSILSDTQTLVVTGTSTPTITPTITLTRTPTLTSSPTNVPGIIFFSPGLSTTQIYYGSCEPNTVLISLQIPSDDFVKHIELYVRLLSKGNSDSTNWDHYSVMTKHGGGSYSTTVNANEVSGAERFNRATLMYQFIVVGVDGSVIARSHSFTDLNLNNCKNPAFPGVIIAPTFQLLPSNTPEVVK
jgi:hypothetical protein